MEHSSARIRDALALAFASFFPLLMAFYYFVALGKPEDDASPALRWAFGIGKSIQFLFPIAYVWWFEREQIGPAWPTRRGLLLGAGFGLAVGAGMFALYFGFVKDIPAVATETPVKIHEKV